MKSRSMKKFMRKAVSAVSAVAMAIMLAAPAVSTQAFAADGKAANSVTYIGKNTIKTYDGKSLTYDSSVTFTTKNSDGSYSELSLADAKTAVKDGQEVKVYTKAHAEGYGSVWSESYDYTNYRTGVQIGEDSDVAIGTEGVGGKLTGTLLEDFNLVSTSKNFNPIVVNKSDATIKGATIVAGNADGKDNSEGRNDINDFVGYGTAVNIYGDSVTTGGGADANGQMGGTTETNATYKTIIDMTEGGSITTYGVARPAVAVDNGGDVIIKGDGNDKTQEISVNGGTLYDGFKNTADTVKMVSPPWVLGVVGNSRATNMLGKGSTMVVQDADVYAKSWGALSTDSGSNPFLYAINSNISMDTTSDDASGYGTYAPELRKLHQQRLREDLERYATSMHRPVFCKILLQGFAPPTIMYLYIISKGAWHSRFPGLPGALDSKQKGGRPMPRIAVVDDQPDMRQQLCSMIDQYSRENNCMLEVTTFSDGAQIITNYCKGFDIIFLDIEMPELGGMDAAERIRTVDPDVVLVFVTNMAQYAIRGYEVDALDFVLKPVNYYQFSTKLARALQRVQRRKGGQIALQTAGGVQLLNTEDIYWLETRDRMLHYHTSTGVWSVRSSLQNAEKQLAPYHFAKCNQCYLVNLRYVRAVQNDMVQVGEDRLEISRRQRAAFLAAVAAYVGGAM